MQDVACASVIRDMSYNQLICMLVDADAVQTVNQSSAGVSFPPTIPGRVGPSRS
jgi:hypothetical protein